MMLVVLCFAFFILMVSVYLLFLFNLDKRETQCATNKYTNMSIGLRVMRDFLKKKYVTYENNKQDATYHLWF